MAKLLIANWKSNPETLTEAVKLAKAEDRVDVVIAPPSIFMESVGRVITKAKLGAQDAFWTGGPYTGSVSVEQLKKFGVKYIIIGHSERRRNFGETDEVINRKLKSVLSMGLKAVLCVGEGPEYRRNPRGAKNFVNYQLKNALKGTGVKNLLVAYEPVWAIGTGFADSPEGAEDMAREIKNAVGRFSSLDNIPVLYGGSVTAKNASRFLSIPEISGALVGGASLASTEFKKIIKIAKNIKS